MKPFFFLLVVFGGPAIVSFWLCGISLVGRLAGLLLVVPIWCMGNTLHELSHAIAIWALGGKITDAHLVPNVFKGDFCAYVMSEGDSRTPWAGTFICLAPYLIDVAILLLMVLLLTHVRRWNQIVLSGVILFAVVRPLGAMIKEGYFLLGNVRCDFTNLIPYVGKTCSIAMALGLLLVQTLLVAMMVVVIRKANC